MTHVARMLAGVLVTALLTGCADEAPAQSVCGDDGTLLRHGATDACFYASALVIEGGFECPQGLSHRIVLGDAMLCSSKALDEQERMELCAGLGADCESPAEVGVTTVLPGSPEPRRILDGGTLSGLETSPLDPSALGDCSQAIPCPGDYNITSRADLESLAGCKVVGELSIAWVDGIGRDDIDSLAPLACLEEVGNLRLNWLRNVESLHGLERLRRVTSIEIQGLSALTSLDGLEGLEEIRWGLYIVYMNSSLTDVSALHGVTLQGGGLEVSGAPALSICAVDVLIAALQANGSEPGGITVSEVAPCPAPAQCVEGTCVGG